MIDYTFPEIDAQGNFLSPLVKSRIQELTYTRTGTGRPDQPSTTSGVITGSEPVGTVYNSTGGSGTVAGTWRKTSTGWTDLEQALAAVSQSNPSHIAVTPQGRLVHRPGGTTVLTTTTSGRLAATRA